MERKKLIEYLPNYLTSFKEIQALTFGEQIEVDGLLLELDKTLNNQFIRDANENGVTRYESMLGISKKASQSLDERKFNILANINAKLPYTINALKAQLETLCGKNGFSVLMENDIYKLSVKVELVAKNNLIAVSEMLEKMLPCNLVFTVELIYNQHKTLGKFKHSELKSRSHYDLRNEVIKNG